MILGTFGPIAFLRTLWLGKYVEGPMVTRIYTPPIQPYTHTVPLQGRVSQGAQEAPTSPGEDTQQLSIQEREAQQQEQEQQGPNGGFGSLTAPGQTIPIQNVLTDFSSTMNALGVDNNTNAEVTAYLNVVKIQANKEKPDINFIKQALRSAANTMDQFISQALGQPSRVVRDWVDALLMQPIDFKQGHAAQTLPPTNPAAVSTDSSQPLSSEEAKRLVSDWVRQSKTLAQQGQFKDAKTLVRQSLSQMNQSGQNNASVTQGRLYALLGRYEAQDGNKEAALRQYQRAYDYFNTNRTDTDTSQRQAKTLSALSRLYDELGQLDQAQQHYEALLRHPGYDASPAVSGQAYNDLGSIYLRQGEPQKAIDTFQLAYQQVQGADPQNPGLPDILSNLGTAQQAARQYHQAAQAYRLSLKLAKSQQNRDAYQAGLEALAQLYDEANLGDRAAAVRQRLQLFQAGSLGESTVATSASAL